MSEREGEGAQELTRAWPFHVNRPARGECEGGCAVVVVVCVCVCVCVCGVCVCVFFFGGGAEAVSMEGVQELARA